MKTTIPTTPEVRRLNKAVEEADWILGSPNDYLDAWLLVKRLRASAYMPYNCRKLADEIELADAAVAGDLGDVPGACRHRWVPDGYAKDGTGFVHCSECGLSQEV